MFDINDLNDEEKFALLFGILSGDGCISCYHNKRGSKCFCISITGDYYSDQEFFISIVVPLISYIRKKEVNFRKRPNYGKIEINFTDKNLFHILKNNGFPVGKKGQKLIIPESFFERGLLKYIVQGFFATDGSIVLTKNPNKFYPRIESVVIHKVFLKQVYDYLVSIGLKGAYYKSKSKPDSRWKSPQEKYRFQFNGKNNLFLFNGLIGFINPKHKQKFLNFIEYNKNYNFAMKGIAPRKQKDIREKVNLGFKDKMAALRVELRTSSS